MGASLPMNQPLPPKEPPSLGRLARRISAWTTNSLLTLMLVVIALGFGREVLHWWHDEGTLPAAAPAMPADRLGDAAAPHVLEFGDQAWSIRRQEFSGPPGDVPAALQAACRAAIVDTPAPRRVARCSRARTVETAWPASGPWPKSRASGGFTPGVQAIRC